MNHEHESNPDGFGEQNSADAVRAFLQFLRIVYHRKIYLVASLAIIGFFGAFYYFTTTRIYEATAQLLILQSGPDVWQPTMGAESSRQALIPTYERLFSSAVVLEGAVKVLLKTTPEMRTDFTGQPRDKWVGILRNNLSANAIRRTNVIEIGYKSKSPAAAEAVVGAVVQSYLDFMEQNHKNVSAEIVKILENERSGIEQKLTAKQQQLLNVQKQVRSLGLEDNHNVAHPAVQRVVRLNESLIAVQQERLQLEASLAAIRQAAREGGDVRQHLSTIEPIIGRELTMNALGLTVQDSETRARIERQLIQQKAELAEKLKHYGDAHPEVTTLAASIRGSEQYLADYQIMVDQRLAQLGNGDLARMLIRMVEEKLANAWQHENKLSRQYEQAETEAVKLNDRMAEMKIVEHDLQRLRNLHDTLLNRIANIDIGQDHTDVRVEVVSEPKAKGNPVSPRLTLVGLMCLLGGAGLGVALIYVVDVLDDRFRSPEELQDQLRTPLLAMIRELRVAADTGINALQVHVASESVESEAFRTLRTTLAFSGQDLDCLAITSAEPSDGKTTVLSNLGVSYAHADKRTLLIDADLRRPGLSKLFDMRGLGGLSEVLRSTDDLNEMCEQRRQSTGIDGLDVLPCGPKPGNPAELLASSRFVDVLGWAQANYDQVLVDCPPILAASDAAIVGRLTEGLILVVQPEKNHRRMVLRAVSGLASMGVSLIGVVANKISAENGKGYYGYGGGYGYGYGYGYGTGYGEEDTDESETYDLNAYRDGDDGQEAPASSVAESMTQIRPRRAA